MKRISKNILHVFLLLLTCMLLAACSGPEKTVNAPPDSVCNSIINTKCVKCHYTTRICDALGTKSAAKWRSTINFMMKQGAGLTEDEQQKVVACLSSMPAGSNIVCK